MRQASTLDRLESWLFILVTGTRDSFGTEMTSLTEIKVRGKKQSQTSHAEGLLSNSSSKRNRVFSSAPEAKRVRRVSLLEDLPTELLEVIFFYCLNVSLPQASLVIGRKLASRHVKSQLIFRVLSSPSSTEYPCALSAILPTLREQAEAQSAILRLKWMTLPFLRDIIPDYIVRTIARELGVWKVMWRGTGPEVSMACEPLIRQYLEENADRMNEVMVEGLPAYWETKWLANRGTESRTIYMGIGLRDGLVTLGESYQIPRHRIPSQESRVQFSRWRVLCGVEGCKIPEKLLHGPWSDEKCEFLEIAIRGDASVDWVGTTSGEVAKEGLSQALEERNARAVGALLARVGPSQHPLDSLKSPYYSYEDSPIIPTIKYSEYEDVPVRRGVGIVPTTEQFRKAVVAVYDEGRKEDVVRALLRAAETAIDADDDMATFFPKELATKRLYGQWLASETNPFDS